MAIKPEKLTTIYKKNDIIRAMSQRVQHINKLNAILKQLIPAQFSAHCSLANIDQHTVIIHCSNANYASLLRFQTDSLCKGLSRHLPQVVNKLEVKVRPQPIHSNQSTTQARSLSQAAASSLQETVNTLEEGTLKRALQKLLNKKV